MMTLMLIIIFMMYIGLGIPDSVLGVAWPAMYRELGLSISLAGYITATVSAFTIVSSLFSTKFINKFGGGIVAAVSTLLTAIGLLGYSFSEKPVFLFLLAIPLGLGAGAIDAALNGFVTLHYSASKMSFLHCFYGLGITASPFVMSLVLGEGSWRSGYRIMAAVQLAIALLGFAALPLWKKIKNEGSREELEQVTVPLKELVKKPKVWLSGFSLFFADAILITAGSWCSSYFVNFKGLTPDRAAQMAMLYYAGLAAGRFLSGVFADRIGRRKMLKISLGVLFCAMLLFALPLNLNIGAVALFLIGAGIGPVYPNLAHMTPKIFGADIAQSVIGFQQAMCYAGIMLMPSLFGLLAQFFSTALLPYYLLGMLLLCGITSTVLIKSQSKSVKCKN